MDLSGCQFDTTSHTEIVSALQNNSGLTALNLGASATPYRVLVEKENADEMDQETKLTMHNPATVPLLFALQTLVEKNFTLQYLKISTDDCEINSFGKDPHWSHKSLHGAVEAIAFGLQLNIAGRGKIFGGDRGNQKKANRDDWIEALVDSRDDVGILDYFLRQNPGAFLTAE